MMGTNLVTVVVRRIISKLGAVELFVVLSL